MGHYRAGLAVSSDVALALSDEIRRAAVGACNSLLHGALVTIGFLVPGLLLTWLINRGERLSSGMLFIDQSPPAH
jgi:hypothetical protein